MLRGLRLPPTTHNDSRSDARQRRVYSYPF
jgi:hypothetical protein